MFIRVLGSGEGQAFCPGMTEFDCGRGPQTVAGFAGRQEPGRHREPEATKV